ncbi:ATP-dependent helicase [Pendulispora albinea]|uniref:DNA 3'-5' helicase n=1 Tax=Pendulispora albinea TaxID=2741071 RepID=A0ABZ2LU61_9BACT
MSSVDVELNTPQAEAVAHVNGPLLVFAGAGSGKTRVITYRVANLIARERIAPYRILAVTFTNKAAGEMKHRLTGLAGEDVVRDLWVGTFHATCARLLRRHGEAIGLTRNFLIYDTQDQKAVVTRVLRELDLDERRYPPRSVLYQIHKEKQEGRGPDEMSPESYVDDAVIKVFRRYEAHMREANAVDFEDLIGHMVRLLEREGEGDAIRRRFSHVLVDEFQDTNAMQYRLVRALVRDHNNICVVGDDDQSIYRWRGADVRNIRYFRRDFPGATVVKLEQNYRSTGNIVRAALGVIAPSPHREPKELWTQNDNGPPIEVMAAADERDEAAFVTGRVLDARKAGASLREIAVFYRVHAQSRVLEEALRIANLPYQIVGGTKFYERAEVKDALAYLRLLANPRSDVDLLRIINTPARGIGTTTVDRLVSFAGSRNQSIHEALEVIDEARDIAAAAQKRLAALRHLLERLRARVEIASPSDVFLEMIEQTGYREALRADNTAESDARLENLAELGGSIREYEASAAAAGEKASLDGFLESVSLQSDIDGLRDEPRVTLMTVHGAKGLEFEYVFLTGMEEDMFPYKSMDERGDEELEEERRLAYVALTRARRHLVLTHTQARQIFGKTRWGAPSRFLRDLPREAIVHKQTRGAKSVPQRFIDRPERPLAPAPWAAASRGGWGAPSAPPAPARPAPSQTPGQRYVDREFFQDDHGGESAPLRRGSRVRHQQFGEGEVRSVVHAAEPAVVAFFPGWGEKKILTRFLRPA